MSPLLSVLAPPPPGNERAALAHGRVCMVGSALLFGAMAVAARSVAQRMPPAEVALVRFAIGLGGVALIALARPQPRPTRWGLLALRGGFGGVAVLAYFVALERLGTGLGTLLNNTYPLWACLVAALFLREAITSQIALGMGIALAGLLVVVGPQDILASVRGLGDPRTTVGLVGGVISGVIGGFAVTSIRLLRRTESALAVFGAFCTGGVVVCIVPAWFVWRPIDPREIPILLAVGLLSIAAQMLFTYALKFVPAGTGSLTNLLTIVASYALAMVFLAEPIALHVATGGLIVMAGILLASWPGGVRAAPAPAVE